MSLLMGCGSPPTDHAGGGTAVVFGSTSLSKPMAEGGSVYSALKKEGISVEHNPLLGSEAFTKVMAERNNPPANVVVIQMSLFYKGVAAGLWEKLDTAKLKNAAGISDMAKPDNLQGQGIGLYGQTLGIEYRKDILKEKGIPAPTDWSDLENPKLKGRVALSSTSSVVGTWEIATFAAQNGGSATDADPGFAYAAGLAKSGQVRLFGRSGSDISQLLGKGEAWVAIQYDQAALTLARDNPDIGFTYPESGMPIEPTVAAIPKGAEDVDAAYAAIDAILGQKTQLELANDVLAMPIVTDLGDRDQITPGVEEATKGRVSVQQLLGDYGDRVVAIPYADIVGDLDKWNERWLADVESKVSN
jgi:putative spermidine/putrescine transport system substrate-binding protein